MLKITLPNGVVIEGDVQDLVPLVSEIISPEEKVSDVAEPVAEPVAKPEEPKVESSGIVQEPEKRGKPLKFPHRYTDDGHRSIGIGAREDQTLQAAKLIAEQAGNRSEEFTTREVMEIVNDGATIWRIGSALQHLLAKGLVRHGKHSRCWYVTERGWSARFSIIQPLRKPVTPTT